jgi:diguanylate cyclase
MAFINKKPLTIILGFIVALQIALIYYYHLSIDREYESLRSDLSSQAIMLSSNLKERVSVVKGVSSFIQTVGIDAEPDLINHYLAVAYGNSKQLLNILVAPDGIIKYVYPVSGNTAIQNKSLFLNSELSTPGLIQETIRSRQITVDGPRILAQGKRGMVIRKALYHDHKFTGIVSVTLLIDDVVQEFLPRDTQAVVTQEDGTYLFGNRQMGEGRIITVPIDLYNQQWQMGMALDPKKKQDVLRNALGIDFVLLLALAFILYFMWNQSRFNQELERLVSIRTRDLRVSEQLYEKLAYYDSLTEIPNRRYFMDEFDRLLRSAGPSQTFTLFFFDLNKFKEINDTLGHSAGDQVLKTLAKRIVDGKLPCRMFARTGGDEFVMLFEDLPRDSISVIAGQIASLISETMTIAGAQMNVSTSIGVSLYPEHSENKEDLLKFADMSMYQAKSQDVTDFFIFDWSLAKDLEQKTTIAKQLHSALDNNEFVLHYQPQVNGVTGEIIGLEALIRWNHPEKGLIGPGYFINAVEEAGLMIQLTDWVIREVCRQLCDWRSGGMPLLRTSINISNSWFYNRNLIENLFAILDQYELGSDVLEFEITESIALLEEHYPLLQQMRDRGIIVSIDDFGTKYSSLNYLKHFPVDKIKIDRTFITGIGLSPIDETIIKSIAFVASQLGYDLIAEGVETREQADFLIGHNCHHIQGFFFFTPLPADDIRKLFE